MLKTKAQIDQNAPHSNLEHEEHTLVVALWCFMKTKSKRKEKQKKKNKHDVKGIL